MKVGKTLRGVWVLALSLFLLSACIGPDSDNNDDGSNDSQRTEQNQPDPSQGNAQTGNTPPSPPADPVLTRIVIDQSKGHFFSDLGQSETFTAKAYDQYGDEFQTTFSWHSNSPDNISVDQSTGVAAPLVVGSSSITAQAEGISSAPVMAVYAQYQPGVVVLPGDKLVSPPELDSPSGTDVQYGVGMRFQVQVESTTLPDIGTIVVGEGAIPYAGRVVEATDLGDGTQALMLEIVPVADVFSDLNVDEDFDVSLSEVQLLDEVSALYDIKMNADGTTTLTPKSTETGGNSPPPATRNLGPQGTRALFDCDVKPEGLTDLFKLELGNSAVSFTKDISVPLKITDRGLELLALRGEVTAQFKSKASFSIAVEPKVSCKMLLGIVSVPVPGPLGFLVGIQLPLGLGAEFGGKVKLADTGVTLEAKAQGKVEYGYRNPPSCDTFALGCGFYGTTESSSDAKVSLDLPDIKTNSGILNSADNLTNDFTFEPSASAFGYAVLAVGNPYFSGALSIQLLEVRLGATQAFNLATPRAQLSKSDYKSDYKLTVDAIAKPGEDVEKALQFFKVASFGKIEAKYSVLLAKSPNALRLTVDAIDYATDDLLTFKVKMDPANMNYLPGVYNIDQIHVYKAPVVNGDEPELLASATPNGEQTEFELSWTADSNGSATNRFFAFVSTDLLPIPLLGELELGLFKSDTSDGNIQTFKHDYFNGMSFYTLSGGGLAPANIIAHEESTSDGFLSHAIDESVDMGYVDRWGLSYPAAATVTSSISTQVTSDTSGTTLTLAMAGSGTTEGATHPSPLGGTCNGPCVMVGGSGVSHGMNVLWGFEVVSSPVQCVVNGSVSGATYNLYLAPYDGIANASVLPGSSVFPMYSGAGVAPATSVLLASNMSSDPRYSYIDATAIPVSFNNQATTLQPGQYAFYMANYMHYSYGDSSVGHIVFNPMSGSSQTDLTVQCATVP